MEKSLKKLSDSYEFVLIGCNMASLQMASGLARDQKKFCILDCKHTGNSLFKFVPALNGNLYVSLPFNSPLGELSEQEQKLIGPFRKVSHSPLSFSKGEFHGFQGFGDQKVQGHKALIPYCGDQRLVTQKNPEDFWDELTPLIEDHLFLDQQITDIHWSGREIKKLVFNGRTKVCGQFFYFFDKIPFVFEKLGCESHDVIRETKTPVTGFHGRSEMGSQFKKQIRQFARIKWFSSVNLMIHHRQRPENFDLDQSYLLMGSKPQVCLGMFSRIKGELISRWQSFFPSELTLSPEDTGGFLRELRRQVQRAFPLLKKSEESINGEFVSVQNSVFADLRGFSLKNGKLGDFNNLFIYSPHLNSSVGWIHDRLMGYRAYQTSQKYFEEKKFPAIEVAGPASPC